MPRGRGFTAIEKPTARPVSCRRPLEAVVCRDEAADLRRCVPPPHEHDVRDESDHIMDVILDRCSSKEEIIMNILLWYLPYAMFSGACDVVLAERETETGSERRADSAKRKRNTKEAALARAA